MTDATLPREDTRSRIQAIACELFAEQGYDKTSLREIAERLGVTKAALYYHFRSKEEIVESLIGDHSARMDVLLEWAEQQQPTPDLRREFVRRYMENLSVGPHFKVMKLFQQNQTAMKNMAGAARMRENMAKMIDILSGEGADAAARMRIGLAIFGLHVSWMLLPEEHYSEGDRREAAIATAYDLMDVKS